MLTHRCDPGRASLAAILNFHGVMVDQERLAHELGDAALGVAEIVRGALKFGMRARLVRGNALRLDRASLPAIVKISDRFEILARVNAKQVLVHDPLIGRPRIIDRHEFLSVWDGTLILATRRLPLAHRSRRFDLSWFVGAIKKYKGLFLEILFASFFLQLFALVTPVFFQVVIDKVLVHRGISTLEVLAIGLLVLSSFESILATLRLHLFAHTTNRIDVELGARLFRHLVALPISYFEARRAGDSVARVRELENIRSFLTSSAMTMVIDLAFTIVFVAVLFYYSTQLAWIVVGSLPAYLLVSVILTPMFRRRLEHKFDCGAENQAFLVETLTGIETLKAMALEPQMSKRWEEQLAAYVQASFGVVSLGNGASQTIQFLNKLVTVAILYFGAKAVIENTLTVGELVAFNMLAQRVSQPVLRLANVWQDFHQVRVSVERLGDILNAVQEPARSTDRSALPAIRGTITFEDVCFRYRLDSALVLDRVDLNIRAGQVIGIVGASGSGKSTLTKLIQRLYVPEAGRVYIDGIDVATVDAAWLRRQIGVVLQDNVLFNRSIRENIGLANPALSMDRIMAAAELAGAHEFILRLPMGYDTVVGERGTSLSGGQRQRIAIARALADNPRILIFDEATSALDYESERIVQDNMRRMSAGRTVLIIAHRLSTVRLADRILTLEEGRLIEDGSHDDLIRSAGRYANLYRLQAGLHETV